MCLESKCAVLTVSQSDQLTSSCMLVHCLQENAKLHYGHPEEFTLTVPQFSIKPGEVVAVVGRVGCGEWGVWSKGCGKSRT